MSKPTKILFLTHRVPYPPNRGDRIRAYHLLRQLNRVGQVWLGSMAEEHVQPSTRQHLQSLCREIAIVPVRPYRRWANAAWSMAAGRTATEGLFASRRLRHRISKWTASNTFDATVVFCSSMAQYLTNSNDKQTTTIVDLVDVDSQKWFDYAAKARGLKRWLYRLEGRRVRALEERLARSVDGLTVVSQPEADLFRSFCPDGKVYAIGNGVDTNYFQPDDPETRSEPLHCVFVGVLDYHANVDGLTWFCENVWSHVKSELKDAKFSIVGRRPCPAVMRLQRYAGVNVVGEVPDVRPYLSRASVAVAPLRIARGVQNKVLEAMAAGLPVIATPSALTGIDLRPGCEAHVADGAADWRKTLVQLLTDNKRQAELQIAGRAYVEEHHAWDQKLAKFEELIATPECSAREASELPAPNQLAPVVVVH